MFTIFYVILMHIKWIVMNYICTSLISEIIHYRHDGLRHFRTSIMDTNCSSQKVTMDTNFRSRQLVCSDIVEAAMFMMDSRDVHDGQQLRVVINIIIFVYVCFLNASSCTLSHLVIRTCWMGYILSWILYLIHNLRDFFLKQHLLHDIFCSSRFSFKSDGTGNSSIWMIFTRIVPAVMDNLAGRVRPREDRGLPDTNYSISAPRSSPRPRGLGVIHPVCSVYRLMLEETGVRG